MFKKPADVLDYTLDFAQWLDGDSITAATFTAKSVTGLVIDSQSHTAHAATVWLSGGNIGSQ